MITIVQRQISAPMRMAEFNEGGIPLDFTIRVNRLVKPNIVYPLTVKQPVYPELDCTGPPEFDLLKSGQLYIDNPSKGVLSCMDVYDSLQVDNALRFCFNLQDALAIIDKGAAVFKRLWKGKALFLWGSVVENHDNSMSVPFLHENFQNLLVISWFALNREWHPFIFYSPVRLTG